MSIRINTGESFAEARIHFVLPDDVHDGPVSVVGTFNGWRPGAHRLIRRNNGTRSVGVSVPTGGELCFRYLGSGGVWFDDPDAHEIRADGGVLHV